MRTSKIVLFYNITQKEIVPPALKELERKDKWLKEVQGSVEADWKPLIIRCTYEMFDPEVQNQMRFFNGTCIDYFVIQDKDLLDREPTTEERKQYREEILDEMLGYDYQTAHRVVRKRQSTADFKSVQKWNTFLNQLEETIFDAHGYEFPDSKAFWDLEKEVGHEKAKAISIKKLQERLKAKV
jgi:hypothetical protein